jgi:phosphate uptake regulator
MVEAMEPELRGDFHRELDALDISVAALLGLLPDAIRMATTALLGAGDLAKHVWEWRGLVEDLYGGVAGTVESIVARQAPVARDLRFLLGCIRLVPTLYDSVDLVADVASPSCAGVAAAADERARSLIIDVGEQTALTWAAVEHLWSRRDDAAIAAVYDRDDRLAEVRSALSAELRTGALDVSMTMQLALVGRSFEWLGRHAATAARVIVLIGPKRPEDAVAWRHGTRGRQVGRGVAGRAHA